MEKFIESFDDFRGNVKIDEASEIAEFNKKIKDMGEQAKEAREKAVEAKNKYEKFTKDGSHKEAKIELLKHTKFKAQSTMLDASVDLMLIEKGKEPISKDDNKKKDDKSEDKKGKE